MTLHQTVESIRKFGLIIIGIVLVFFMFSLILGIFGKLTPKKEAPPTVSFGPLPTISFPQSASQSVKTTYTLDTISGDFPFFPDRLKVYTIQQYQQNLLSYRNAVALISQDLFPNPPKAISNIVYQWTSSATPQEILTYNIVTQDFSVTSSYITNDSFIGILKAQDQTSAISIAKGFLTGFNGYPTDIDPTKTQTTLYSINSLTRTLQPAISISTTQVVQVDFFQKDIDETPIYYPDPLHSLISAIVANNIVVAAQSTHKVVLQDPSGTYPIKNPQAAFKELQEGKAYIAAAANPPVDQINIRDMSLGYFISGGQQQYLMPIVVFKGDNGFYAYVSAITDPWIKK